MKQTLRTALALAAAMGLCLSLAACGGGNSAPASEAPSSSSQAQATVQPSSAPASSAAASLPENTVDSLSFLSDEQAGLYDNAHETYLQLMNLTIPNGRFFAEGGEMKEADYNGLPYYKATGEIQSWDDFYAEVTGIFTTEYFDELNGTGEQHPMWVDIDGELYNLQGARGWNIEYVGPDLYRPISDTEEEATFMVVGQYEDANTGEAYTEEFPITMVNTPDGWRVSQFNITF